MHGTFMLTQVERSSVISIEIHHVVIGLQTNLRPGSPVSTYTAFGSLLCTHKHNQMYSTDL